MATVTKDFRVKNGIVVEGSTATVNGHDILTEALVDVKGDLLVASGADAVTRLAAGTNGYVLTADSSTTEGIKWAAAPAVGSFETSIVFEGATADSFETTLTVTDPTEDRTITFPNATGTVALTGNITTAIDALTTKQIEEDQDYLYFTNERAQDAVGNAVGTGLTYTDSTGAISVTANTYDAYGAAAAAQTAAESTASGYVSTHAGLTETHGATGAVVGTTNTQTLTNKTLTSPVVTGLTINDSSIVFEGSSADDNETTLTVTNPTGDRTITLPDATGTVITTGNLHNITEFGVLTSAIVMEGTTANDFELTISAGDPTADRTVTFPDATGTVALTNNKLDVFAATTSAELRTVISDETGTGGLVFADTPTLVTPNIGAATGTSLVLSGDLTVNGTTTTINSTEITIDDKNLTLGSVASPTDAGADGGGITLKGATDKTLNWVDATDAWTSSEHVNLASGKELKIDGTSVLSSSTLGSGVTGSSLTSVGTISSGTWNGTTIAVANGGTGITSFGAGIADFLGTPSSANLRTAVTDETGTGALVFADTPTLTTPNIGAATATSLTLTDALIGTATQALTGGTATVVDSWSGTTYSSAKYLVQMKKGTEIQTLEVLINVDGSNNVAITEYADVINAEASLGTTDADYSGGNVRLLVTASDGTTVKVHKTLIEA